jgi:phosphoesterase RecJ-like protein
MFQKSGANINDTEDVANSIRSLATVEVAIFLKEREEGDIKVSLRSQEYVDVSSIAIAFGGGGHTRASGFTVSKTTIEKLYAEILEKLKGVI